MQRRSFFGAVGAFFLGLAGIKGRAAPFVPNQEKLRQMGCSEAVERRLLQELQAMDGDFCRHMTDEPFGVSY